MLSTYFVLAVFVSCAATSPIDECHDSYCPRGEKCVLENILCITEPCPYPQKTCIPVDKPGTCPKDISWKWPCLSFCQHDDNCPGDLVCCGDCFRRCVQPEVLPKACPLRPPNEFGICIVDCPSEGCPVGQQCCGNCPATCTVPVEVKPGSCPLVSSPQCAENATNTCREDNVCPKAQKCCNTGCALECRDPDY